VSNWTTHKDARVRWTAKKLETRELLGEAIAIALRHHCTFHDVAGRGRGKLVVRARHAIWAWLRGLGFSYTEVGFLWGVEHSTVMAAIRAIPRGCTERNPGACVSVAEWSTGRGHDVCLRRSDERATNAGW